MATQDAVRRIALSLPGVRENTSRFAFGIENKGKEKGIAWSWLERVHPKKARVPNNEVLAIRVADQLEKEALLAADEEKFFTEPHYNGYPAVLVRIAAVSEAELRKLLTDAWECQAPRELREGKKPVTKTRSPSKKSPAAKTTKSPSKKSPAAKTTKSPSKKSAAAKNR
jgi:hypothetical protein